MGVGYGKGDNKAQDAVRQAIASPLLETSIDGATGVIINFTGGVDLGAIEVYEAAEIVREAADIDANIIFGAVVDDRLGDDFQVTVIATGFEQGGSDKDMELAEPYTIPFSRREDQDIPAYVRKNKKTEGNEPIRMGMIIDESVIEEDEYNTPTFLRKQAD